MKMAQSYAIKSIPHRSNGVTRASTMAIGSMGLTQAKAIHSFGFALNVVDHDLAALAKG
jgi:hypothetical protein